MAQLWVLRTSEQSQQMLGWVFASGECLSNAFEEGTGRFVCRHDSLHECPEDIHGSLGVDVDVAQHRARVGQAVCKGFILSVRELQLELKRVLVLGCESDGSLNVPGVEGFRESAAEVTGSIDPPPVRLEVG